jgi:hypothetical protein
LVLIIEVLKEAEFKEGIWKRNLEKKFGKRKKGYKVVRY